MRLPIIHGLIRRRMLVNFRVDAAVMQRQLPTRFRPKLHKGYAIAGICLIRLEEIRPSWLPDFCGMASENAAHRIAVLWDEPSGETREGVFIPRRDTGSFLNHAAGGRIFTGEHNLADFRVNDDGHRVDFSMKSRDGHVSINLKAHEADSICEGSCFESLAESSRFFETGSVGYSVTHDCCKFDGMRLQTHEWKVNALAVDSIQSSYFKDESLFPAGSVRFDHALIMRDIRHEWHGMPDIVTK